jgi:hypothetical protein
MTGSLTGNLTGNLNPHSSGPTAPELPPNSCPQLSPARARPDQLARPPGSSQGRLRVALTAHPRERGLKPERGAGRATRRSVAEPP